MAKTKVQITIDDELLRDVNDYCDKNYMNRSCLVSQSLLQVINQQKVIDSLTNLTIAIKNISQTGNVDENILQEINSFELLCKMLISKQ